LLEWGYYFEVGSHAHAKCAVSQYGLGSWSTHHFPIKGICIALGSVISSELGSSNLQQSPDISR